VVKDENAPSRKRRVFWVNKIETLRKDSCFKNLGRFEFPLYRIELGQNDPDHHGIQSHGEFPLYGIELVIKF
jgi:hypothetical protein